MPIENKRGINPPEMDNTSHLLQHYLQYLWRLLKEVTFKINLLPEENTKLPTGITIIRMPYPTIYLFFIDHPATHQPQAIIEIDTREISSDLESNPQLSFHQPPNQYISVEVIFSLFDLLFYYPALYSLFASDNAIPHPTSPFLNNPPLISLGVAQENLSSLPDSPLFVTHYHEPYWFYENEGTDLSRFTKPDLPVRNFYPLLHAFRTLKPPLPNENKIAQLILSSLVRFDLPSRFDLDFPNDNNLPILP